MNNFPICWFLWKWGDVSSPSIKPSLSVRFHPCCFVSYSPLVLSSWIVHVLHENGLIVANWLFALLLLQNSVRDMSALRPVWGGRMQNERKACYLFCGSRTVCILGQIWKTVTVLSVFKSKDCSRSFQTVPLMCLDAILYRFWLTVRMLYTPFSLIHVMRDWDV